MSEQKKKQIDILEIRNVEIKKGERAGQKAAVIQFSKGVKVLFEGQEVDLGQYNNVFLTPVDQMKADIDGLVQRGYIQEDEAERRKERLTEKQVRSGVRARLK